MKILSVQTIDVAGVATGLYSFAKPSGEAHDRVLVSGGSGSGKTRLLQLIVATRDLLATGQRAEETLSFIRPENSTSKVILSWELSAEEQSTIGAPSPVVSTEVIFCDGEEDPVDQRMSFLLERYAHDDDTPKFEYFSERRRLDVGGGEPSLAEVDQVDLRTDPSPRKFAWLPSFLARLPDEPAQAARFASSLARFSASCAYDVEAHALSSWGRRLRSLTELSASEADAVIFSATATLVGLSRSIVLVDRPDLHGLEATRALAGLSALGTDNQLIRATSSPAFAATFDGAVVHLATPRASRASE
ncbi:MAG: hypothetical protein U0414_43520 [Polyangiaceae bacterium]